MSNTTQQFKKQLPRNFFMQILSFCTQVGVGIWLVPYLVHYLGIVAYGLIPLMGMLVQYVGLITANISNAVNHFFTIALQRNDPEEANKVFNTSLASILILSAIQLLFLALITTSIDKLINIPPKLYNDAIIFFMCSVGTYIANLVSAIFGVAMYATNRLDISRAIDIARHLLRAIGIVSLFYFFSPSLRHVGYVYFVVAIFLSTSQIFIAKRLIPSLRISIYYFDITKVIPLLTMGWWLIINQIGALLFLQMDIWICNRFIGPTAAGEYAAIFQWPALIRNAGAVISSLIAPMIMIYYAKFEFDKLVRLENIAIRLLSSILAISIVIICLYSPTLLHLWLGKSFIHLAPLLTLMLSHLIINVGTLPLFNIQIAMNKIKTPALITFFSGILNILLAIVFIKYLDLGMYGIALAGALVLTAKNAVFTPLYAAKILNVASFTFIKPYLISIGAAIIVFSIAYPITMNLQPSNWIQLIFYSAILFILALPIIWFSLPKNDKELLLCTYKTAFANISGHK